jgi:mannitol-1-phosphate/altronate dehydrogenase
MNPIFREKIIRICNEKIEKKGENVGLSFYAFFSNKNTDPDLLMQMAKWWIKTHQLDHFEKANKIRQLILDNK